jgi:hypothetical protein
MSMMRTSGWFRFFLSDGFFSSGRGSGQPQITTVEGTRIVRETVAFLATLPTELANDLTQAAVLRVPRACH